jgi:23S rRNA (guanosine2251-2'-O)-methyltransferase
MREFLYGRNAVYEALRTRRKDCREFHSLQIAESAKSRGRIDDIMKLAAVHKIPASLVPRIKLDDLGVNHQGVALEAGPYPYTDLTDILDLARERGEPPFVLILDALQDPQNFGSLLRTAEIVGVHGVVIPLAHTVEVTPAVVNASAGASEHLLIARSNLAQAMESLSAADVWLVGLDPHGEALTREAAAKHLRGALGLVVGSEGEGLRELTRKKCDLLLRLPMRGQVDSLNASVAGSVGLYLAYMARDQPAQK